MGLQCEFLQTTTGPQAPVVLGQARTHNAPQYERLWMTIMPLVPVILNKLTRIAPPASITMNDHRALVLVIGSDKLTVPFLT